MALWYHAKNDQQQGPVSDEEIKSQIAAGNIPPDTLVWREGMDDWQAAGELPELFGERPIAPPPMAAQPRQNRPRSGRNFLQWLDLDILQTLRPAGQWLLIGGFLLVIASKGCDAVSQRYAERVKAQAALAQDEFMYEYDLREARLELEREEINAETELSDYDQQRLEEIDEALVELRESREQEQRRLRRTTWQRLQFASRTADANRLQAAVWYTALFVLGSMLLTVGLLIVGLTGTGAQSWLSLGILAIIAFSIYVAGTAWIGKLLP